MDHRLIDSCGLVVMIGDLFQLYTYYKYGTAYPQELADFETVLKKDLAKAGNEKRFAKDKKFWDDQLDALGEPLYSDIQGPSVLEEARKRHGNPKLRSSDIEMKDLFVAVKDYYLEPGPTKNLIDFCMNHQLSMTNLLLLGIRTYLSKVNNGQEDITIQNFISRRSTHDEWTSGGSRTIMFPCRTVIAPETDFLSAAYEIQNMQNRIYMHSNYDPAFIMDEMRKRYNTPEHTGYESCYLTYQPMTVKVENEMLGTIRQHAKWFANGAATKKMYLTVSHTEDGGMNFSYHYQTAHLEEHDMELLYYYMMRILFKGIAEPDMSIGEIMELVKSISGGNAMNQEMEFKNIVAQYSKVASEEMNNEMRFREDLGFSSLDFMSFLGELEDTFDLELDESEVLKITTLGEALNLLEELQ